LFAECDGDEKLIKVAYIKQRATKLKAGAMASALEVVRPIKNSHTEDHQKTVDVLAAKPLKQSASSEPVTPLTLGAYISINGKIRRSKTV
jgi:hypothetical protein